MRVYVSGAIAGLDRDEAKKKFEEATTAVVWHGHEAVNAILIPKCDGTVDGHTWECALRLDLIEMLKCDALYMMDGWQKSRGARLEHFVALQVGLKIIYEVWESL